MEWEICNLNVQLANRQQLRDVSSQLGAESHASSNSLPQRPQELCAKEAIAECVYGTNSLYRLHYRWVIPLKAFTKRDSKRHNKVKLCSGTDSKPTLAFYLYA